MVTPQDKGWWRGLGMIWVTQYSSNVSESCHGCPWCQCSFWEWETGVTWHAAPLLLAIHGIKKGMKISVWPNNQSLCVSNSLWRKFMQQTGLQSFLQCALWCDTWLWMKGNVSISYQAFNFLLCFQLIFVYEWRNGSGENSYAVSSTDIFIVSKSYAGILAEYCVLAMQTVPQSHGF